MEQSTEQKILKYISYAELAMAALYFFLIAFVVAALVFGLNNPEIAADAQSSLPNAVWGIAKLLVSTVLLFLNYRALGDLSLDNTKHHKAWILTLVLLAYCLFDFITDLGAGAPRYLFMTVLSVLANCIALFLIDRIRKQSKTAK